MKLVIDADGCPVVALAVKTAEKYGVRCVLVCDTAHTFSNVSAEIITVSQGAGNLGRAVASHMSFEERGFNLIGIFDRNEALAGQLVRNLPIRHIDGLYDFCRDNNPTVAVLCIPSESAQEITDELVKLGVKGFWNFSHYDIASHHPEVAVENVHLSDSLMTLSYHINNLK